MSNFIRGALIQCLLQIKGTSQSHIAASMLLGKSGVGEVIFGQCRSGRIEHAVAAALELPVWQVFSNYYSPTGERLKTDPRNTVVDVRALLAAIAAEVGA